ncbi:MAG: transposase [Rhizobiales bacterium]|nr:transposase [Hyphomicrobiales bacterium]
MCRPRQDSVYADEASGWDVLHGQYETRRINHSFAFSDDGACTNQAESYLSRLRLHQKIHHERGRY